MPPVSIQSDPVAQGALQPADARWWERPVMVGIVISMFAHVALMFVGALVLLRTPSEGGEVGEAPSLSLGDDSGNEVTFLAPAALAGGSVGGVQSIADTQSFAINEVSDTFADADKITSDLSLEGLTGAGTGAGIGAGSGEGQGQGGGGLGGAGGEARFFGVEARGSRFAFVVDVSGSMMGPAKIGALQAALIESIQSMLEQAHFCVVLYSSGALPLMGEEWTRASDDHKQIAQRSVRSIQPSGGTNPIPAFQIVFALKPRPDAVYFMTDGMFSKEVEDELPSLLEQYQRDGEGRTAIHCISFVDRGAEKIMRRIARMTGGSYTHVEGPRP